MFRQRAGQYRAVAEALVGAGEELPGRPGENSIDTVEFTLGLVNSVCREQVLFKEVTPLRGKRRSVTALKLRQADTVHRGLCGHIE